MRFVMALMRHETNTFSPLLTPLSAFGPSGNAEVPLSGDAAIKFYRGTNNPIAAYLDLAQKEGAEIMIPIAAEAHPGGKVTDDAFDFMVNSITKAVEAGCDALLLDLHGAMVTESFDDGEGELLRRIRVISPELPIAVALDFHANLTANMVDLATIITSYRTYPHIDMYETGLRAGRILIRSLEGEINPIMVWHSLPMLTHMLRQTPSQQPMKDIMNKAIVEEADGKVLSASIMGGFPLSDIPHVGLSGIVATNGDQLGAKQLLYELLGMAWERRADFVFSIEPLAASIARAKDLEEGPVILADHGDNCGAGGTQDVMDVLKEVMDQDLENVAAGPFCDPISVKRMIEAGVGAQITLELGGKTDMPALKMKGKPLKVSGTVRRITDGQFKVTGPMKTGMVLNMGRTAVLDTGKIEIVVSEDRFEPIDVGCFTHIGIDPRFKKFVLIKSRQHFRAGFEPIAKHIILVAGPGVCASDYSLFPFERLRRPIYPLDLNAMPFDKTPAGQHRS